MAVSIPRFCVDCASPLEMRLLEGRERPWCAPCNRIVYLDPKVAAGAIVALDGRIVLARRSIDPSRGLWTIPGGYVDRGETVEQAAVREVREEVGLDVIVERLIGVYSFTDSIVVVVVYAARPTGGILAVGDESLEVTAVAPADIPWDDLAFPSVRQSLRDYLGEG